MISFALSFWCVKLSAEGETTMMLKCSVCSFSLFYDDTTEEWYCENCGNSLREKSTTTMKKNDEIWHNDWIEAQKEYNLPEYKEENYRKFCADMHAEGYQLRHYEGRYFYKGPGCVVDDPMEAQQITTVKLQSDNMGKSQFIVYPK